MVAADKLDSQQFKRLIQSIVSISYRYNVIAKLQTNEMEKVYSRALPLRARIWKETYYFPADYLFVNCYCLNTSR